MGGPTWVATDCDVVGDTGGSMCRCQVEGLFPSHVLLPTEEGSSDICDTTVEINSG